MAQTETLEVETLLKERVASIRPWEEPVAYDASEEADVRSLTEDLSSGRIAKVIDNAEAIAADLFELHHPDQRQDQTLKQEFVSDILAKGAKFGKWFLFPWSGELVRFPEKDDHRALRTSRNRNLITTDEQQRLYDASVLVCGLSVGSSVVEQMVLTGVGGKFTLADMDTIEPSNLNRINGEFTDVGSMKVDRLAKKISIVDPYLEQTHLREGITADELTALAQEQTPAIIVDEVDDLAMKALLRFFAQENKVPLIMATDVGDRSVLDVERYDVDSDTKPFHGKLKDTELAELAGNDLGDKQRKDLMMKIVGLRNITPRLIDSVLEIDKSVSGLPQLGSTATAGGVLATIASREIILGRPLPSGRYTFSPKKIMKLSPQEGKLESVRIFKRLIDSRKKTD